MAESNATSSANDSYVPIPGSLATDTYAFGEIAIAPASVVRCFGSGDSGDHFKVSRQWDFRKGDLVFTLYDWKSTSLYDPDLWSPEELWRNEWAFDLHVGSREPTTKKDVTEFIDFLLRRTSRTA